MNENLKRKPLSVYIVANNKGGTGKTLTSLAFHDWLSLMSIAPSVVQIDRQKRLSDAIGGSVLTIAADPKASRIDPEIEVGRFSPLLDRIEKVNGNTPILIDVGAGEVDRFATWAALVDLEEELSEWLLPCYVLIPYLAEAEAIRQAAWTADRLHNVLPNATIYLIENRRDGALAKQHPHSAAADAAREFLDPWAKKLRTIIMPAIPAGSWRYFEAANCRFIDVVDMSTTQIMSLTGLPRAESKIVRGDVSQWLVTVFDQFDNSLNIAEGFL